MAFKTGATPSFLSFTIASDYGFFDFALPPHNPNNAAPASHLLCSDVASSSISYSTFCRKRARPLADIDGSCREITKKRRLRLTFVTSRLSDPFASPPTNNVDRGNCKIAVWARQKSTMASTQFRKAAILNRIKRETMAAREAQQRQIELARQQYCQQQLAIAFAQAAAKATNPATPQRNSKRIEAQKTKKQKSNAIPNSSTKSTKNKSLVKVVPITPATPTAPPRRSPLYVPIRCRPPTPPSEAEIEKQMQLVKQRTKGKKPNLEKQKSKRTTKKKGVE